MNKGERMEEQKRDITSTAPTMSSVVSMSHRPAPGELSRGPFQYSGKKRRRNTRLVGDAQIQEIRDENFERGEQDDDEAYPVDEILRQQYGNYDKQEHERDRQRIAAEDQQAKRDQEQLKDELDKIPLYSVPDKG